MITNATRLERQYGVELTTQERNRANYLSGQLTELLVRYLNNRFLNTEVKYDSDTISFVADDTINDSDSGFTAFQDGDSICLLNSKRNDGFYCILNHSNASLTVYPEIVDETVDNEITIILQNYPRGLVRTATDMLYFDLYNRKETTGYKSERIGTYSYTLQDIDGIGYPKDMVGSLQSYKIPKVV